MKERLEAKQWFQQEADPIWGVRSFRFEDAMVLPDENCPSEKYKLRDDYQEVCKIVEDYAKEQE